MAEETHYEMRQDECRRLFKSTGDFERRALCGYGSYHFKGSRKLSRVTCPACQTKLGNSGILACLNPED
jgi:hypothetical protein